MQIIALHVENTETRNHRKANLSCVMWNITGIKYADQIGLKMNETLMTEALLYNSHLWLVSLYKSYSFLLRVFLSLPFNVSVLYGSPVMTLAVNRL